MEQQTVVITGGAGEIGFACAEVLLEQKWKVVLADLDGEALQRRKQDLAARFDPALIQVRTFDVRSVQSVTELFASCRDAGLNITGLVNCAGVISPAASLEVTEDQWDHVLGINLKGVFFCCQQAARYMVGEGDGRIVNIGSIAAETAWPKRASYAASKVGVNQLTKTLAVEWAEFGIRVNAVGPAWVDTELLAPAVQHGYIDLDCIRNAIPMKRLAAPRDIAEAVLFFLDERSGFVTGQVLYVDGGYLTGSPSKAIQPR